MGAEPLGDGDQQLVAGAVAQAVVDGLEVVEVEEQHGRLLSGSVATECRADLLGEEQPVGQTREGVVERLVAELFLDAIVLEQHARVAGEGLEELAVVRIERGDVPCPLSDEERAHDPILGPEHGEHGVGQLPLLQVGVQVVSRAPAREQDRVGLAGGEVDGDRLVLAQLRALQQPLARRADRASQGRLARTGGQEDDLGELGREHRARGREQLAHGRAKLGRALHRAHRLVEELHVRVPPTLARVGP